MDRRSLRVALVSCLLACSATAGAQEESPQEESPRAYIVSVPMDPSMDAIATRTGSAARAALRTIPNVNWRGPDQAFLGYDESAITVLDRARESLNAGRQAYLNLELQQAIEHLTSAVADFDAAAAAMEDPGDLGTALLFLGATHAANNQRRQALATFRRLHTQMPHIHPDTGLFNPEVIQLFEAASPNDAGSPSGVISIQSDPPGAVAYVDFLARGRTPINVEGLIAGEHVVRVSRPGATPFVETVTVRRGRPASTQATLADHPPLEGLSDALAQIAGADVSRFSSDGPIGAVARLLDLAKIGVIRVSPAGEGQATLELLLFDVASGRRLVRGQGTVPTEVGRLEEGVQRLVAGAFEAALRSSQAAAAQADSPPIAPIAPDPVPAGRSIADEPWFWAILIGSIALVGIAVGIGVAIATQPPALANDRDGQVIFTF